MSLTYVPKAALGPTSKMQEGRLNVSDAKLYPM